MNQGNDGKYKKDNGVFQDGALIIAYPSDKWIAFFFAFQSQSFDTDDKGNRKETSTETPGKPKKKAQKKSAKKPPHKNAPKVTKKRKKK